MQPWRVRHGQARRHDLAAGDVQHHAAIDAAFAPAIGDIAAADRGDVGRPGAIHGQAVQVAAILGGQGADEGRAPERTETRRVAEGGEAAEGGVDEDRPGRGHALHLPDADVVDVEAAGDAGLARDEAAVGAVGGSHAGWHVVAEAPEHGLSAGPERVAIGPQTLTLLEQPLMGAQRAVGAQAEEDQPAGLVGGQSEAGAAFRQPSRQSWGGDQDLAGRGRLGGFG